MKLVIVRENGKEDNTQQIIERIQNGNGLSLLLHVAPHKMFGIFLRF